MFPHNDQYRYFSYIHMKNNLMKTRLSIILAVLISFIGMSSILVSAVSDAGETRTPVYKSLEEMDGKRIGMQVGTVFDVFLNESVPGARIEYFNTFPDEINALKASKIDGASKMQTLFRVTIPNVMPSITICTFLSLTNGFKLFDQNLALTGGAPIISTFENGLFTQIKSTEMLALNIYNTFYGQNANARGTAQAKAVLFFILVALIGIIQLRATRKKEVQQ